MVVCCLRQALHTQVSSLKNCLHVYYFSCIQFVLLLFLPVYRHFLYILIHICCRFCYENNGSLNSKAGENQAIAFLANTNLHTHTHNAVHVKLVIVVMYKNCNLYICHMKVCTWEWNIAKWRKNCIKHHENCVYKSECAYTLTHLAKLWLLCEN